MEKILKDIVDKRLKTIEQKGIEFGIDVPKERKAPLILPDFNKGAIICEIKRGSPSQGKMNSIEDPVSWASDYIEAGADAISILTEEDFFFGSLNDLINIKNAFPNITVLRKDFLLSEEEIEVSYRAGADMILLIASVLLSLDNNSTSLLSRMIKKAESFGILPLIEVHDKEEYDLIKNLDIKLLGINSRDLKTFKINRGYPVGLKEIISESINVVYESGIRNKTEAMFAGMSSFSSVLVGTSIIKSGNIKEKITDIKTGFTEGRKTSSRFFRKIFKKIMIDKERAVKICGITNIEDANAAVDNGADIIGFIFADSPRKIEFSEAKEISEKIGNGVLKVGVIVNKDIDGVIKAVKDGWLDAVQFHGDITPEEASSYDAAWYKAVRVKTKEDFDTNFYSPFMLYDAFSEENYGGTGKRINPELLNYAIEQGIDLYLAGGITPDNIEEILVKYNPLMIDISSGLEKSPGKKDHDKIKKFFKIMNLHKDIK